MGWNYVLMPPCLPGQYLLDCVLGSCLTNGGKVGCAKWKRKENSGLRADGKYWDQRIVQCRFILQLPQLVWLLDFFFYIGFPSSLLWLKHSKKWGCKIFVTTVCVFHLLSSPAWQVRAVSQMVHGLLCLCICVYCGPVALFQLVYTS